MVHCKPEYTRDHLKKKNNKESGGPEIRTQVLNVIGTPALPRCHLVLFVKIMKGVYYIIKTIHGQKKQKNTRAVFERTNGQGTPHRPCPETCKKFTCGFESAAKSAGPS